MPQTLKYFAALIIGSGILFALDYTNTLNAAADFTRINFISPVTGTVAAGVRWTTDTTASLFSFRSIVSEQETIKEERDHYRGEYFRLLAVQEENEFLRNALELSESEKTRLILADVVSTDPLRSQQVIIINKGTDDGVATGDAVMTAGRILVGRVLETSGQTSRVLLVTSSESRIPSRLERSQTNAVISGSASGALILDLVLPETTLYEGEIILSSGLGGNIPANLLLGQVSKVVSEETASFKKAVVRPFFDPADLRQVFVVKQ